MKPAPFDYHCPRTLDDALALLEEYGPDAKPLAGGQSLIPAMNFRLATPAVLVDLNKIAPLSYISEDAAREDATASDRVATAHVDHDEAAGRGTAAGAAGGTPAQIRIGAMVRHREVEQSAMIARHAPLLTATMPFVAHAAIRTRGTVGGSLAHADPAAELPAVMLALDARFLLSSRQGTRTVTADRFFTGLFATALDAGELLTEITIPVAAPRTACAFHEVSRRHGDFALAGVAVVVSTDDSGRVATARIALLSVGDRPVLSQRAAAALLGESPTAEAIRATAHAASQDLDPPGDIHASSRYRRQLADVLTRRALQQAFATLERT